VAPLSPFFLASLLNASCTNTYAVDIPYFSCLLEDNTYCRRKGTELRTLIRIRVGSTCQSAHDQVERQYNNNSSCDSDATKPNITASPYHQSNRSEVFRDLPVLGRRSAAVPSDNHWDSSIFICHGDRFSSGVRSANYVIQHAVNVRLSTLWKLNDSAFVPPLRPQYRPCDGFSGEGPGTTRNNQRCSPNKQKDSYNEDKQEGEKT
jgi:hypothetical protein